MYTFRIRRFLVLGTVLCFAAGRSFGSGGGEMLTDASVPHIQPEPAAVAGYLDGRLGVLWPSYDRRYLLIAYRVATGLRAVSDADRAALTALPDTTYRPPSVRIDEAIGRWVAARRDAGAAAATYAPVAGWREGGYYAYANNCDPHAFETAAQTLAARREAHAGATAELQQWIAAQDSVFSACDPHRDALPMPGLDDRAPEWLVRDHAYQSAALLFYRQDFAAAQAAFDAIAADTPSPWSEWAGYLRVRAWWRGAFRLPEDYRRFTTETPDWTQHAMYLALQRASESKNAAVQQAATELRDALETRFAPKDALAEQWQTATAQRPPESVGDWVRDLRFIWAVASETEIADDWIFATRSLQTASYDTSPEPALTRLRARWDEQHAPIVLASLLMAATPDTPGLDALLEASRESKTGTPLHMHFAWQRTRLALAAGKLDEARRELAGVDAPLASESTGTRQHFDQLAMLAAPSLDALAGHLVRIPVIAEDPWTGAVEFRTGDAVTPGLDAETGIWLATRVHGEDLLRLAQHATLPASVRLQLAGEAWRWGALLPDAALERAALEQIVALTPDAALSAALAADRLDEVRYLAALWLLNGKLPRVESQSDGGAMTSFVGARSDEPLTPSSHWNAAPAFYDAARRSAQAGAYATLTRSNETTWMGRQILPWITRHTDAANAPATLRQLVYASRYGAKDTTTSRQAFQLLHRLYPKSDEARDTKYYY